MRPCNRAWRAAATHALMDRGPRQRDLAVPSMDALDAWLDISLLLQSGRAPHIAVHPLQHAAAHAAVPRPFDRCACALLAHPPPMSGLPASLRFGPPVARAPGAAAAAAAWAAPPPAGAGGRRKEEVGRCCCIFWAFTTPGRCVHHGLASPPPALQTPQDVAAAWRAECERVAPQLNIAVPADAGADSRDWRPLLERALAALASLQAAAPAAQAATAAAGARLASELDALAASEAAAGAQLTGLRVQHRAALEAVATLQREAEARREYVDQLQAELAYLNKVWGPRERKGRRGRAGGTRRGRPDGGEACPVGHGQQGCAAAAGLRRGACVVGGSPPPHTAHPAPPAHTHGPAPHPQSLPRRSWRSGSARWRSRGRA